VRQEQLGQVHHAAHVDLNLRIFDHKFDGSAKGRFSPGALLPARRGRCPARSLGKGEVLCTTRAAPLRLSRLRAAGCHDAIPSLTSLQVSSQGSSTAKSAPTCRWMPAGGAAQTASVSRALPPSAHTPHRHPRHQPVIAPDRPLQTM
jgi:hypothetical protein